MRAARWRWTAAVIAAGACLFALYLAQARTVIVNSDPASLMLQAWQMVHGNVLLHGWVVADVSFYTTELPEYAMVSLLVGLRPEVAHVAAALTYTLLVLLAALLARGRGPGGLPRALVAGGILLAPGLGRATSQLLGAPDHLGTGVPILAVLLLIDLAPSRWWVPVLAGLGLAWAVVADPLTLYAACVPLAVTGVVRAVVRRSAYDGWLFAAAVASVGLARGAQELIRLSGGFTGNNVPGALLAPLSAAGHHARVTGQSVLLLFGADFWDAGSAFGRFVAVVHFAGVALALAALVIGIARFFRLRDRVSQVLVAGILVLLAAGVFGTHLANVTFAHEIAVVLPFGAALAGRLVAPLLFGQSAAAAASGAAPARAAAPALLPAPAAPAHAASAQAASAQAASAHGTPGQGASGQGASGQGTRFPGQGPGATASSETASSGTASSRMASSGTGSSGIASSGMPSSGTGPSGTGPSGTASPGGGVNGRRPGGAPGRSARPMAPVASAVLGAVLAVYLAGLGYAAAQPAATPAGLPLARWLEARGLRQGLSGYWQGSSVMLGSGLRVHLAVLRPDGTGVYKWESQNSWYDPRLHDATFVIVSSPPGRATPDSARYPAVPAGNVRAFFGKPARTYSYDGYGIWVYDKNLLDRLNPGTGDKA